MYTKEGVYALPLCRALVLAKDKVRKHEEIFARTQYEQESHTLSGAH